MAACALSGFTSSRLLRATRHQGFSGVKRSSRRLPARAHVVSLSVMFIVVAYFIRGETVEDNTVHHHREQNTQTSVSVVVHHDMFMLAPVARSGWCRC